MVTPPPRTKATKGPSGGRLYLCPCGVILHTWPAAHTTICPSATPTPPQPGGPEVVTITMEQMHLDVAITGADPEIPYWCDPDEGEEQWLTIEIGSDGIGGVGYYYTNPGTHHVRVAREDGTVLLEQDVNAQP